MPHYRPNVRKNQVPTWWQEVRAWLVVVSLVVGLRVAYYLTMGV
jgi:hypothetical protein